MTTVTEAILSGAPPAPLARPAQRAGALDAARRIPSLDGLRAISITLVLLGHAILHGETRFAGLSFRNVLLSLIANGKLGVQIFFVISGFLITTLLLQEHSRRGSISLKHFYIRRVFRIFPAYYALIAVVAILALTNRIQVTPKDLLHACTFSWIYNFAEWNWYLGHTWSLSVEEQFYLLWPATLVLLGPRRAVWLAVGLILVMPPARGGLGMNETGNLHRAFYIMVAGRFDTLMFGCLTALLWNSDRFQAIASWVLSTGGQFVAVFGTLAIASASMLWPRTFAHLPVAMFRETFLAAGITLSMIWLIKRPTSPAGRILNSRPFVSLGILSYSLYLWQQLFLTPTPSRPLQTLPLNLLCALAAAVASFYLIEQPFTRLRARWFSIERADKSR